MSFVSYAQNFEDVLLHRVFGGQETGFYVDVGAYHPVDGSVTKVFYDRGWSGINIEPGSVFDTLNADRPRDVNLQMVVCDHVGEVAFIEDPRDRGMSHIVHDPVECGSRMVPSDTLENIVRTYSRGRPIDFLKVDAEGAESSIVKSTDWRSLRPRILVFETTLPWSSVLNNQTWEPVLLDQGYIRTYFDGINCFYVTEEEAPLLQRHFDVPVNVLDCVNRHDPGAVRATAEMKATQQQLQAELARAQASLASSESEQSALRHAYDEVVAKHSDSESELQSLRTRFSQLSAAQAILDSERADLLARQSAHADSISALNTSLTHVTEERDRIVAALNAQRVERDDVESQLRSVIAELDDTLAERDVLLAQCNALESERNSSIADRKSLVAERDSIAASRDELSVERLNLARSVESLELERDRLVALKNTVIVEPNATSITPESPAHRLGRGAETAPSDILSASPRTRRPWARTFARVAYGVVRPIVRPMVWRLRTFMIGGLTQLVTEQARDSERHMSHWHSETRDHLLSIRHQTGVDLPAQIARIPTAISNSAHPNQDAAGAEMRHLAKEMERALLTLAMSPAANASHARETEMVIAL